MFNTTDHTHMPYIIDSENILFCVAPKKDRIIQEDVNQGRYVGVINTKYQAYDIYTGKMDGSDMTYVGSQCTPKSISCSPNCYTRQDGKVVMNYVSNLTYSGVQNYIHFQRIGDSLSSLGTKERVRNKWGIMDYCASESNKYSFTPYCKLNRSYFFAYDKQYNVDIKIVPKCDRLLRVLPIANSEENVIITYNYKGKPRSSLINMSTKSIKDIKVNGEHVYKCSIFNDIVVHSVRGQGSKYSMKLQKDNYDLVTSEISI